MVVYISCFPGSSAGKEPAFNAGDETLIHFLGQEVPLEKDTATHSCILAWRVSWTVEPGELQSTGFQSQTGLSNSTKTTKGVMKTQQ